MGYSRYRYVNFVFLATIIISYMAPFIPFASFVKNRILLLVISQIILIIPFIVYLFVTKQKYSTAIGLKKLSIPNVLLLTVFSFCLRPLMTLVNAFSRQYAVDSTAGLMIDIATQNPFLLTLVCVAIIPAIFEESVYRGAFYQEYRKMNPLGAIFFSALLFGLLHGNLNQFTYAFIMGIIMAVVIEATDSILSTMIIHFVLNGVSVVALYALPLIDENYKELLAEASQVQKFDLKVILQVNIVPVVIGCIIGYFVLVQVANNCQRLDHMRELFRSRREEDKLKRLPIPSLLTFPLVLGIAICIITIIANEILVRGVFK